MKIKRLISLLLTIVICLGFFTFPVGADTYGASDEKVLYALGILDSAYNDLAKAVTRIEMVKYVTRLCAIEAIPANGETPFADVPAENEASGAVNFAITKNIISKAEMFYPDRTVKYEEAVKMIVAAFDYNDLAIQMGGYPNGYLALASEIGLLKDVTAGGGSELTLNGVVKLLSNALDCTVCNTTLTTNKNTGADVIISDSSAKESVLNKRFKISKYGAFIAEYDSSTGNVKAEIRSKDKDDSIAEFNVGDVVNLTVSSKAEIGDIKYTYSNIYVNDANELVFAVADKNIEIVIGHIYEINKSHIDAEQYPSYIENIGFENSEDYVDVADSCRFYFNGQPVGDNVAYSFIGTFSRAVIYKDEIISLEAYELSEGGIITNVGDNDITYIKGETSDALLDDIYGYKNISVYVNGLLSDFLFVSNGTFFDYYASENKDTLIVVASTVEITDDFYSYGGNKLNIGKDQYPLSENFKVYCSTNGDKYKASNDFSLLLKRTVTVYIDFAGYVRYIRPVLEDELSKEYYAFLMGYNQEGLGQPEFLAYVLKDGVIEKNIYTISEYTANKYADDIATIRKKITDINEADEGDKNTALKESNIVYKIMVDDKGRITRFAEATKFSDPVLNPMYETKNGFEISDYLATSQQIISSSAPRIYFNDATVCVMFYSENLGIVIQDVQWSLLASRGSTTPLLLTPYAEEGSSDIDLMLIRGDLENLSHKRVENVLSGLLTDVSIGYDAETEKEVINVKINGESFVVSKYSDALEGVTDVAYIEYVKDNPFLLEKEVMINTVFNLSGVPESWEIESGVDVNGIHKDEFERFDNKRAFFTSGDAWYMGEGVPVYQIVETNGNVKFVKSKKGNVTMGVDVWYVYYNKEIRALFYR